LQLPSQEKGRVVKVFSYFNIFGFFDRLLLASSKNRIRNYIPNKRCL